MSYEYDQTPAAKARRAMGRRPDHPEIIEGVGQITPRTESDLAERRAAWVAFHTAHGTLDEHGGLTAKAHAMLDINERHAEHMSGLGPNHLGMLTDDEARELVRRMAMDGEAVKVAGGAEVTGPGDGPSSAYWEAQRRVQQGTP